MPIYEYSCSACGHILEALQKFSDDPLKFCPECSEPSLKKQVSAAAFHLKGTGWYQTDFRDSGKKPEEKKTKKTEADGATKSSDSKSDSGKSSSSTSDTSKSSSSSASS